MKSKVLFLTIALFGTQSLFGYVLEGQSWTLNRTVVMQLSLGPAKTLLDGSTSFNQSAQNALEVWNPYLAHLHFSPILFSPVVPDPDDDEMSVFFAANVFGDKFGSGVLAVTLLGARGTVFETSDTVFNSAYTWDSYRGAFNPSVLDFRQGRDP